MSYSHCIAYVRQISPLALQTLSYWAIGLYLVRGNDSFEGGRNNSVALKQQLEESFCGQHVEKFLDFQKGLLEYFLQLILIIKVHTMHSTDESWLEKRKISSLI